MTERRKTNRPSTIDKLPKPVRDLIEKLRMDGASIDDILAHLEEMDVEVSRSAMGRHIIPLDDIIADIRRSKLEAAEVASQLKGEGIDDFAPLVRELLEVEFFRLLKSYRAHGVKIGPDTLKALTSAAAGLSRSRKTEADIQEAADKRAEKRLATKVEKAADAAKAKGFSKETVDFIAGKVLGVE